MTAPTQAIPRGSTTLPHFPMIIGGRRLEAVSGRRYETVDPFRGQPWATAADADAADADLAGAAARAAPSGPWGPLPRFRPARLPREGGGPIARGPDYPA